MYEFVFFLISWSTCYDVMCFFFFYMTVFILYRKLNSVHLTQLSDKFFSLATQNVAFPATVNLFISVIVIVPDGFQQLS
jgi:hypothetical protein